MYYPAFLMQKLQAFQNLPYDSFTHVDWKTVRRGVQDLVPYCVAFRAQSKLVGNARYRLLNEALTTFAQDVRNDCEMLIADRESVSVQRHARCCNASSDGCLANLLQYADFVRFAFQVILGHPGGQKFDGGEGVIAMYHPSQYSNGSSQRKSIHLVSRASQTVASAPQPNFRTTMYRPHCSCCPNHILQC